ncbi:MAG: hypothetical protein NTX22_01720 [Ignavibacteriales bacterium]|nr:hypothetical protein [Ignavibacteriales bacterium]
MNIKQTNKVNMFERVAAYLALFKTKIVYSTAFQEAINSLEELTEAIWAKDNEKSGATSGKIDTKTQSGAALVTQTLKVTAALFLWGKKNKNDEIKALAGIKKSEFNGLRDAQKVNKAKAIYEAAKDKDLTFAGVEAADINQLNTIADEFKGGITDIGSGASKRISAGVSLDEMITQGDTAIKEDIDNFMQAYVDKNPEFYTGYKAARVIYDKGGKHKTQESEKAEEIKK